MSKASSLLRDFIGNEMLRRRAKQIVDRMPEFAPPPATDLDPKIVQQFIECEFIGKLAAHTGASYREVEDLFDGLSACLHGLVGSAEGRKALSYIMTQPGTPLMAVTSH